MHQLVVERSVWIAAPLERAWRAITEPAQLEQWYAPGSPWLIPTLRVGATVTFYNTDSDILHATIEVVEPLRRLTLRWEPIEHGAVLVTSFVLEEEDGGTRATIVETGYEGLPPDLRQQWADSTSHGYAQSMEQLKGLLEGRLESS
jgi:uncharacterized protein YndB with AHSA1/START domain